MDLGRDKIGGLLLKLAAPSICAQAVNALYNMVDRIYIGRIPEIGSDALTGVGVTFPLITLIMAFAGLIGTGGAPRASIEMGRGNNDRAERIMGNAAALLIITGAVLTVLIFAFRAPLLLAFGASENTVSYASDYIGIYVLGSIFVMLSLGINSFITAQGFSKTGMATVIIGAALNIVLDPIFIFALNMGVRGAALASVISQAVSAAWAVSFVCSRRSVLKLRLGNMRLKKSIVLSIAALGISPFIMQSTESLLTVVLNTTLLRYGGDAAVGSMTIITSAAQILQLPLMGLAQGAQPITSYNYGAGNIPRVKAAVSLLVKCSLTATCLYCLLCELLPRVICSIFTPDPVLLDTASVYLRIYMAGIWAFGLQGPFQNSFIALGEAKTSLFLAVLRKLILLIPLVYILSARFGAVGVFAAEPIADITAATVTTVMFVKSFGKITSRSR